MWFWGNISLKAKARILTRPDCSKVCSQYEKKLIELQATTIVEVELASEWVGVVYSQS